jgi:hypothetical protein
MHASSPPRRNYTVATLHKAIVSPTSVAPPFVNEVIAGTKATSHMNITSTSSARPRAYSASSPKPCSTNPNHSTDGTYDTAAVSPSSSPSPLSVPTGPRPFSLHPSPCSRASLPSCASAMPHPPPSLHVHSLLIRHPALDRVQLSAQEEGGARCRSSRRTPAGRSRNRNRTVRMIRWGRRRGRLVLQSPKGFGI